jgi:Putative MetA-pathway of phenol degradation
VKINFSPTTHLELDIDVPYITIERAPSSTPSRGIGDTNLGAKWNFREAMPGSTRPAFAASFYVEFPTGNEAEGLGSGLTDYWLNFVMQKPMSDATRMNFNLGILFAGNTSTGAVGIETRHGQVYTGGVSLVHDVTSRFSVGAELYGGVSDGAGNDKTQLQALFGAQFAIRDGLSVSLGILGGTYGATPRIGGQLGIAMDLPQIWGTSRSASVSAIPLPIKGPGSL